MTKEQASKPLKVPISTILGHLGDALVAMAAVKDLDKNPTSKVK